MKIIIIGNGKVGYTLAEQLSIANHDLTIIDQAPPALQRADGSLDVMCISGNGASIRTLMEAGARQADLVIAVDALAARNSRRLNRTVQIADTGIHPGSGVGNHRHGMTEDSLGVPVIGIGVPTVVDAATIVNDTMENFIRALESSAALKGVGEVLRSYSPGEKYQFVKELIAPHLNGMFVTPKDVDEMIHHISHTISEALNMLFSENQGS